MEEAKGLKNPSDPVMDSSDLVSMETETPMEELKNDEEVGETLVSSSVNGLMDTTRVEEPKAEDEAPGALLNHLLDITSMEEFKADEEPGVVAPVASIPNGLMAEPNVEQQLDDSALEPPDNLMHTSPMKKPKLDAPSAEEVAAATRITDIEKLRRFCYIGTPSMTVYLVSTMEKLTKEKYEELRLLCDTVGAQQLADCLVDVLINNDDYLPRRDEAMLVVAVYLSTCTNQLERALFRKYFPRLVRTDTELFIFTGLVKLVQDLRGRKTPLSRTIRKAVIEWYTDKSAAVLLQMWSKGEQICASHKNLLRICHYRDVELIPEIKATLELFCTPTRLLGSWPEFLNPLIGSRKKIEGIVKLRKAISALEALPILKELSLTYEQAPENFRADPVLAEYLIPTISYEQLLKTSPRVLRLCKRTQRASYNKYEELLLDKTNMEAANINPLRILLETMRLNKNNREMIAVKRNRPNFLFNVYASSFGHNKALGKRLHITLSLEKFYLGKCLNGRYRSINYLDALVGVAFGYYKTDSDGSKVNYWSDRTGKLKTLPWTNAMTVVEATECCKTQGVQKTKQVLTQILNEAMEDTKTYDVFLIVVPAATRGNPFNSSNTLSNLLKLYREERKCNAKLIIVSLRQNQPSMDYCTVHKQNILELCGVSEHTARIINAFVGDKFH